MLITYYAIGLVIMNKYGFNKISPKSGKLLLNGKVVEMVEAVYRSSPEAEAESVGKQSESVYKRNKLCKL